MLLLYCISYYVICYKCICFLIDTKIYGRSEPKWSPGEFVWELHHPERTCQSRPSRWDPGSGGQSGELVFWGFIWPMWETKRQVVKTGANHLQMSCQVWRNANILNSERGWLLLSSCLSAFLPSQRLAKYLLKWDFNYLSFSLLLFKVRSIFRLHYFCYNDSVSEIIDPLYLPSVAASAHDLSSCFELCASCGRFVSDYGPEGYDCVCQHRLLQALQGLNVGPEYVRTYPPCLLEWTANRKRAHTVLHIHCFDGENTHNCMWSNGLAYILSQKVFVVFRSSRMACDPFDPNLFLIV